MLGLSSSKEKLTNGDNKNHKNHMAMGKTNHEFVKDLTPTISKEGYQEKINCLLVEFSSPPLYAIIQKRFVKNN